MKCSVCMEREADEFARTSGGYLTCLVCDAFERGVAAERHAVSTWLMRMGCAPGDCSIYTREQRGFIIDLSHDVKRAEHLRDLKVGLKHLQVPR